MDLVFIGGSLEQRALWREGVENLLNLPRSGIPLTANIKFIPPGTLSPTGEATTPFAETLWAFDHAEGETQVRNDAPGFGASDAGLIAEALGMGLTYDARLHFHETAAHETGHAVFAAIPQKFRLAIGALFGLETVTKATLFPAGKEWKNRPGEAIAEVFKEAFLPSAFRVFPNRTDITLSYADYPRFRRLVREGLEAIEITVEEFEVDSESDVRTEERDLPQQGGSSLGSGLNLHDNRRSWRTNPRVNASLKTLGIDGWYSSPSSTVLLDSTVLSQKGLSIPARTLTKGVDWEGWQHVAAVTTPSASGAHGHWGAWRQPIDDALRYGSGKMHVQWVFGPSFLNLGSDPSVANELKPFSNLGIVGGEPRGGIPVFKYALAVEGHPKVPLTQMAEVWEEFTPNPGDESFPVIPGSAVTNKASGFLDLAGFDWIHPGSTYTAAEIEKVAELQNPDFPRWVSYFEEAKYFFFTKRTINTSAEFVNWWLHESFWHGLKEQEMFERRLEAVGERFRCHWKIQLHPVWVLGDRSSTTLPPNTAANMLVGDPVGPFEDDLEIEIEERFAYGLASEKYTFYSRQDPVFTSQVHEVDLKIPEDAYALAGFVVSFWERDTWAEDRQGKGTVVLDLEDRYGCPNVSHLEATIETDASGGSTVVGVPITVPEGVAVSMGQTNGRSVSRGRVQGSLA